jgi:hypothetical protein
MDIEIGQKDYTHALRRAHEERDIDLALGKIVDQLNIVAHRE